MPNFFGQPMDLQVKPSAPYNPNQLFQQNGQQVSNWYDYIQQQTQNFGNQLFDFNSPLYQQFQSYLQKVTPGIGTNTLIAPLLASGASGDTSKNIANVRAQDLAQKRNEGINQTTQQFALGNLGQIPGLLGQFSGNLQNQQQQTYQNDLRNDANNGWNQVGGLVGNLAGMFNPLNFMKMGQGGGSGNVTGQGSGWRG